MPLSRTDHDNQVKLKGALQGEPASSKLEALAAALIGRLLNVPVFVSKSGFQHGGDGGTAGLGDRRFRIECKKYSDTTSLSDRELLGEIDHALSRDTALEAWFLIATREVSEQLAQDLIQKGERIGVPVVIIGWKETEFAPLAALCAFAPDLVEAIYSPEAGAFARALQPAADDAMAALRRGLQSWCLGFDALRAQSHAKLQEIWDDSRASAAELGQNVAGGAQPRKVRRQTVHQALTGWWGGAAQRDAPAIVVGQEGGGKTWAALGWVVDNKAVLPVVVLVPSSAAAALSSLSQTVVISFIAQRLYELTRVRNVDHWVRRLEYLLKRPKEEGPALTILFDGMNQEPSIDWPQLLKVLQGATFEGRVCVVATTRTHHFETRLSKLRGLVVAPVLVNVSIYDDAPGGELDQMLAFEGVSRTELHPDLVELARTPRLFRLVVRFRERLIEAGQVTVHRLLWEYGRDSFGERAGKSFSESEWQDWLHEVARHYRNGVKDFTSKSLGETVDRPDLSEREVYARLSDIIDGRFLQPGPSGTMQLIPVVVAHSLAAALLAHLDGQDLSTFAAAETEISTWLDPISGLDERSEILRASVSIMVEREQAPLPAFAGALVTAWLQTQNVSDAHRKELASLASHLPDALLDAVEQSSSHTQASARRWAVNALRAIPRQEGAAFEAIVRRARAWLSIVSRGVRPRPDGDGKHEEHRAERFKKKIGIDASGPLTVFGVPLKLVDQSDGELGALVPLVLEGFPLAKATPCFEAAVVADAVDDLSRIWSVLHWLCLLNEVDPDAMVAALRESSEVMHKRVPEAGVHPDLAARAAALLLWLGGDEADAQKAKTINPKGEQYFCYERDYLANPVRSHFELERRHADLVLRDKERSIAQRSQRTEAFWLDPAFSPPAAFVTELRDAAGSFPIEKLHTQGFYTPEQHILENLSLPLAGCAPAALADMTRRELRDFAHRSPEARYWSAIHIRETFVVAGEVEAAAAAALRRSTRDPDENREAFGAGFLIMLEVRDLNPLDQYSRLMEAGLKFISTDFTEVLRVPTQQDVDALVTRWRNGTSQQKRDLIILLSVHPIVFSDETWAWLSALAAQPEQELRGVLFRLLSQSDEARFGRMLVADGWTWDTALPVWVNHFGTGALINAGFGIPFDQLAPRLAPWRLLEAARRRGAASEEVRLAAEIISQVVAAAQLETPDPGSDLSVNRGEDGPTFTFSVEPRTPADETNSPLASFRAALDADARIQAYERASETAFERITSARKSGASLYLTDLAPADLELAFHHTPDLIERWLDGAQEPTLDFQRRVRLAEGPYLALCELLLKHSPDRGAALWHVLRSTLHIRYVGAANVDEMLHMVFRAPDTQPVAALREELLSLPRCNSDKDLYDLAIAASYNGKSDWLMCMIEKDRQSSLAWRRKRAAVLSGFTSNNALPVPEAWPEDEVKGGQEHLAVRAARHRYYEACSRHWWQTYLAAPDRETAYAAWTLFSRSADHRASVWMAEDIRTHDSATEFFSCKRAHARLNRSNLKNAMKKRAEKLDKTFLGIDIVGGIGPWARH